MASALLLALLGLLLAGWLSKPPPLSAPDAATPQAAIGGDPEAYLRRVEQRVDERVGLVPGAEKRIRWAAAPGQRSEYAIVYLHGFSATRQEIAPVPERVADALGANLFETRLRGHGRRQRALADVRAEDWIEDGLEALAIGRQLGDRLIIIGTSTGASLAVALASHPDFEAVASLVLLSPNFGPSAGGSRLLTAPFAALTIRVLLGAERSWDASNDDQALYWSTRYPSASLIQMMRLVDLAWKQTPLARVDNALLIYSPQDQVVSVDRLRAGFELLPASRRAVQVFDGGGESHHVLVGDILSPQNTDAAVALISEFLGAATPVAGEPPADDRA